MIPSQHHDQALPHLSHLGTAKSLTFGQTNKLVIQSQDERAGNWQTGRRDYWSTAAVHAAPEYF